MQRATLSQFRAQFPADTSRDVRPFFTENNVVDCAEVYSKHFGYLTLIDTAGTVQPSDLQNLRFFQNMQMAFFSMMVNWMSRTPNSLVYRILSIFLLGPKPKVLGSYAGWVVSAWTIMTDAQAIRNQASMQKPRCNMSAYDPIERSSSRNVPVPKRGFCADPQPTGIGLADLYPEAAWERWGKTLRSKVLGCNLDHSSVSLPFGLLARAALLFSQSPV